MIFIYTTFSTKKEARAIAKELVMRKLAACVNIFPIHSLYQWEGKLEDNTEFCAIIKTKRRQFNAIKKYVVGCHGYQIPCIVEVPLGRVLKPYEQWIHANC